MEKDLRLQRRFERRLLNIERWEFNKPMKPLEQRQEYVDYMTGRQMPANAFNSALDIFSDYVFPEVIKEHATRQLDFEGEVWYQKTRPIEIKSNEALHLSRPSEVKSIV